MYSNKLLCVLLFAVFMVYAKGQPAINTLDSFSTKFITSIRANERQRAYLVTDRSFYKSGEYLWFRAFLLDAASLKLSRKNRFLFVDVVNDKDNIIKRVILDAVNDQSGYRIQLPDSLPGGYYWLRAYTKQMAESDTNDVCVKPLYVIGRTNSASLPKPKTNNTATDDEPVINFYPEGGNTLPGINCTIALLATQKNGKPLNIDGYIKDNNGAIATHFTTTATGLGKFDFEPSGYRQYTAIINWKGKEISYPLPPFNFYSGQLSISKQNRFYTLRVLLGDSIYRKDAVTYVIGISRDSLAFASIGKGQYETTIGELTLPEGITSFYLFDNNFKLLSERSIYVHASNININVTMDKNVYARHDKVLLNLSANDVTKRAIPSLVAVSVSDSMFSNKLQQCSFSNMPSDLRMVDNLFLAGNSCFSDDDIDLMMLTRNNTFQAPASNIIRSTATENDSLLYIKGLVVNNRNEPLRNQEITILSKSDNPVFYKDTTDNAGRFCFTFESYIDSTEFIIEAKNIKKGGQNIRVVFDTLTYPKLNTPAALKQYAVIEQARTRQRFNTYYNADVGDEIENQLPTVTVTDEASADYDVSKRISPFSSIIKGKDMDERTSVDNAILKVGGLQLLDGYLIMRGRNSLNRPGPDSEPIIVVQGAQIPVFSDGMGTVSPVMSYLRSLDPKDIDFIEVLKGGESASYGVRAANGVILINLVHKRRDITLDKNNMQAFLAKGVLKPVAFPELNYTKKNKKAVAQKDTRSTVFWNGNLLTADANNSTISFYTSDVPSVYNVTITGITTYGDIIYKTVVVESK